MTGRVFIVTGANSGIGYEVARHLCEGGNDVILACRSEERGKAAVEKILAQNPNALATFLQPIAVLRGLPEVGEIGTEKPVDKGHLREKLDLADLSSVRKFVEDFHSMGKKLHVLINNAGVAYSFKDKTRKFTKDNFEMTMGTNHLGHFLLTHLLLDDLKNTGSECEDCRIVMVTSSVHDISVNPNPKNGIVAMDKDNFLYDKPGTFNGQQAYKDSKLAQLLTAYELARQLEGSNVSVNCLCPGFIPKTGLIRHSSAATKFMLRYFLSGMFKIRNVTRTLDHGMKCVVDLATNEKLKGVSGKYFSDMEEKTSSEESLNEDLQKSVYELSARYCHLEGFEPLDAPVPPPPEETVKTKSKKGKGAQDEKQEAGTSGEGQEVKVEGSKVEGETKEDENKEIKFIDEDDKAVEQKTTEPEKPEETEKHTEQEVDAQTESKEDSGKENIEKIEDIKKVDDVVTPEPTPEITAQ